MKIVIVGATSAIAEHCARLWVTKSPVDLVLLARNKTKVEFIARDLRIRSPQSKIQIIQPNFFNPIEIQSTVTNIVQEAPVDLVLIAQGALPVQKDCQHDLSLCHDMIAINATSPVLYAEAFAAAFEKINQGTIAIIGSIAGDRGRKTNYVYGASKSLIKGYAQGLQHRFAQSHVKIILINPGPTDTPMTVRYKAQGMKMSTVETVSATIVKAIEKGKPVVYVPGIWLIIMWVVRHLPRFIFNKLNV